MEPTRRCIISADLGRLRRLLEVTREFRLEDDLYLGDLENQLDRAKVLKPGSAPEDLVTMNCRVRVRDLDTREVELYRLVYPGKGNGLEGKLSVFAPVGIALLGRRTGDIVQVEVPTGLRRVQVEGVVHEAGADGSSWRV
jgi:regulator of nucleoside diphosphate kinase